MGATASALCCWNSDRMYSVFGDRGPRLLPFPSRSTLLNRYSRPADFFQCIPPGKPAIPSAPLSARHRKVKRLLKIIRSKHSTLHHSAAGRNPVITMLSYKSLRSSRLRVRHQVIKTIRPPFSAINGSSQSCFSLKSNLICLVFLR